MPFRLPKRLRPCRLPRKKSGKRRPGKKGASALSSEDYSVKNSKPDVLKWTDMIARGLIMDIVISGLLLCDLQAQVSGFATVYDEKDLPLQGVLVISKRLGTGVATNLYGSYSLKVYPGDTLEYTMMGFRKEYVAI